MTEWTIGAVLDAIAESVPDRLMTVCGERRSTFGETAERTRRLANFLAGQGFGAHRERDELENWECGQDRVALIMHNDLYPDMVIGCLKARTVPANVNYTLSESVDNGQTSATFFGGNLPFDTLTYRTNPIDSPLVTSNNDRRNRFVGSFHYQPDYLWGVGIGGVLTLESGLPITQKINGSLPASIGSVNSTSTNGTGGFFVAPWVGINTDRQPGRRTLDLRVSKNFVVAGSRRIQVLWEVFNVTNRVNYATFFDSAFDVNSAATSYDAASNVATAWSLKSPET